MRIDVKKKMRGILLYLGKTALLLFVVSVIAFALVDSSPVDPVGQYLIGKTVSKEQRVALEEYWGVNEPPVEKYLGWLSAVVKGNFGTSLLYRRPVIEVIGERFLGSLALMSLAWIFSGIIGFVIGLIMGVNKDGIFDFFLKKFCYILGSAPTFWLGILFLMFFGVYLKWFPIGLSTPIGALNKEVTLMQRLHHLFLPAMTLSFMQISGIALHTRQKLIGVLESEYVLFAKARGENKLQIVMRHGVRNTILPALTLQFASFAELFGGSIMAETVFSYPGLGSAVTAAGLNSDLPLLLGITLFSTLFVCVGNGIANFLYGRVNPVIEGVNKI